MAPTTTPAIQTAQFTISLASATASATSPASCPIPNAPWNPPSAPSTACSFSAPWWKRSLAPPRRQREPWRPILLGAVFDFLPARYVVPARFQIFLADLIYGRRYH